MSAPASIHDAPAAGAGQPARWFHHALQAPPQAAPDNLHGILAGEARGRLRTLALALRQAAGPVLVLADAAAPGPPSGIPIADLDLRPMRAWIPWTAALSVVTATPAEAERTALLLSCALVEARRQLRRRNAAVRTLVIDRELLVGAAQEGGLTIARCGRKVNCSCLVLAASAELPQWRDHAGFIIAERMGRLWLAMDQDFSIDIDALVPAALIVRAHALLHPTQKAD